jgi:hypothetical protein
MWQLNQKYDTITVPDHANSKNKRKMQFCHLGGFIINMQRKISSRVYIKTTSDRTIYIHICNDCKLSYSQ